MRSLVVGGLLLGCAAALCVEMLAAETRRERTAWLLGVFALALLYWIGATLDDIRCGLPRSRKG